MREPTLDRDGYDERYVLAAAETFATGGVVGHAPTVMGELIAAHARRVAEIERLRARVAELESATEWGAKWSDGGYCPASGVNWAASTASNPDRDEEFVREHARMWGTRPIRRHVGPWVYADTGEVVWP
jgi:hypothetical protein